MAEKITKTELVRRFAALHPDVGGCELQRIIQAKHPDVTFGNSTVHQVRKDYLDSIGKNAKPTPAFLRNGHAKPCKADNIKRLLALCNDLGGIAETCELLELLKGNQ